MAEEKHDAGFKVVDRRPFAGDSESRGTGSSTVSEPAPAAPAEPSKPARPEAARPARPEAAKDDGAPRIEIPGGEEDFALEGGPQTYSGFETLVSYLGTTTMFQLGLMAGPSGERIPADLANARQTINMLEVLQEKTKGNLTDDEAGLLDDVLYELRMAYVEVEKRARAK